MKTKRVLLKLSGEALSNCSESVCSENLQSIVEEIKPVLSIGIELSIVIGAGNIWRGAGKKLNRVSADKMGMLATVINAIAISDILKINDIKTVVLSACGVTEFCETFSQQKAEDYLSKGYVVVFAGGTGNPFFTTDTTAALRASEIKADILLKATQVDGIYSSDPKKDTSAVKYDKITYREAVDKQLKIMDTSAFLLCMENNIAIYVFDFHKKGNLAKVLVDQNIGTIVS
ncbi:MAG: UMP kinase [Endomicrobiaceae bacterium]